MRVRLDIAYDGSQFSGWARQPGRRTVQGELESALATVLREPAVALTVAGRTDAGVHALGQVAHCDLDGLPADTVRRLARLLPADLRVTAARPVPDTFDARFSALWRRYQYRLGDTVAGVAPLRRWQVLSWPRPLDEAAMQRAATGLVGLHDFAAFCKQRVGATTIRRLLDLRVVRDGEEIECSVVADAFCHSMVRSLVGALIAVGEGRRPTDWPASLLTSASRVDDVPVAPAHGLVLAEVGYPPDEQLADRAAQTRSRRGL